MEEKMEKEANLTCSLNDSDHVEFRHTSEPNGGPIWLRGSKGVKEFVQSEVTASLSQ